MYNSLLNLYHQYYITQWKFHEKNTKYITDFSNFLFFFGVESERANPFTNYSINGSLSLELLYANFEFRSCVHSVSVDVNITVDLLNLSTLVIWPIRDVSEFGALGQQHQNFAHRPPHAFSSPPFFLASLCSWPFFSPHPQLGCLIIYSLAN